MHCMIISDVTAHSGNFKKLWAKAIPKYQQLNCFVILYLDVQVPKKNPVDLPKSKCSRICFLDLKGNLLEHF